MLCPHCMLFHSVGDSACSLKAIPPHLVWATRVHGRLGFSVPAPWLRRWRVTEPTATSNTLQVALQHTLLSSEYLFCRLFANVSDDMTALLCETCPMLCRCTPRGSGRAIERRGCRQSCRLPGDSSKRPLAYWPARRRACVWLGHRRRSRKKKPRQPWQG